MLTSSLHCLRVSRRSTSTLGTTWGTKGLSRGTKSKQGAPTGPGGSTHLHSADLLLPAVQHFEDGPKGAFGHKTQYLGWWAGRKQGEYPMEVGSGFLGHCILRGVG